VERVTDGLALRDATPADVPLLLRFVRELAEYERLSTHARATADTLHAALFGDTPRAYALLADLSGVPVGFAVWFYNFSTFEARAGLYVEDVFVVPAQRGKGVGRAMFRALARRAVEQGCARMDWTVLDWNRPAHDFYRGIGARPVAGWTMQRLEGVALAALAR
jgi:GNAT superfamily N-acetyltransferase